jgi:hypothetical protein
MKQITFSMPCARITPMMVSHGTLYLTSTHLYFVRDEEAEEKSGGRSHRASMAK